MKSNITPTLPRCSRRPMRINVAGKIRMLRALARSPNKHEAATALARAQELEATTAKAIAHVIALLVKERGFVVRVRRGSARRRAAR